MRTRLELQTAPGSAIGTIGILIGLWEKVAKKVDELVDPRDNELILWRLVYNRHQQTQQEFEASECSPVPIMFGTASLVLADTLWEVSRCPSVIQFACRDVSLHSRANVLLDIDEELIVRKIAASLRA